MESEAPVGMQETIYGVSPAEESHVMSEKVQVLANSIYQELERMISKYDEDVVKQLMPLVVSVLEHLDVSFMENQEHEVELELLREDNEQLVTQFEREKQLRKRSEQKLLELEYSIDDDRRNLRSKVESLESIVRILEVKAKNSSDYASRLEEKEHEMKKEYAKLHERYTEVFKNHVDYMDRTKILFGNDKSEAISSKLRLSQMQLKSGSLYSVSSEESSVKSLSSPQDYSGLTPPSQTADTMRCLKNELQDAQPCKSLCQGLRSQRSGWIDGFGSDLTDLSMSSMPDADDLQESPVDMSSSTTTIQNEKRRPNTLYQELSFQDGDVDDGADITGMGKEVENLIIENNELLTTKNALNIVKDDLIAKVDELTSQMEILQGEIKSLQAVKERLKLRSTELESELVKTKEEAERIRAKLEEEIDIPMAQKKRFTRVEMARVLMERNQYKERLMELQETVRLTESLRASRNDPYSDQKKNQSSIRKFFSNLFSSGSTERPPRRSPSASSGMLYSSPSIHVSPTLDALRKNKLGDRKGIDFLDSELASERLQQQRARERKEQYRQVKAHVKKDDGRMQAYGWSLPVRNASDLSEDDKFSLPYDPSIPVPVPVYCRPLMDKEPGMKIWCAAGVNLNGGRTRDGGSIVGASVFYSSPPEDENLHVKTDMSEIEKLNQELADHEKMRKENEEIEQRLSSLVWIGTSSSVQSKVNVIDARNPGDVLSSFFVCSSHLLCITSVPGSAESDFPVEEEFLQLGVEANKPETPNEQNGEAGVINDIGNVIFVSCSTKCASNPESPTQPEKDMEPVLLRQSAKTADVVNETFSDASSRQHKWIVMKNPPELVKDGVSEVSKDNPLAYEQIEKMSSVLPTMWMGAQNGSIYVHSSVAQWWRCIQTVRLNDSILNIVHIKGRVFAALANGTVAIFHRGKDNEWALNNYHVLDLGQPKHSIRCMIIVHNKVWCGHRNSIHVLDPKTLGIEKTFDAHPRKESQVRQMAWVGDGVWVSIRLDSTLRLYHAHTHQHLQDVDIEPYVSKILGTGKLGFSFIRITAMTVSCSRLWIGTGNGIILSVPLHEPGVTHTLTENGTSREGPIRVYSDGQDNITPGTFVPYCSVSQAQLSFHGHKDAVKFFVAVPGEKILSYKAHSKGQGDMSSITSLVDDKEDDCENSEKTTKPKYMYIMSGAEGYIDFRIGDDDDSDGAEPVDRPKRLSKSEQSHLIVWQLPLPQNAFQIH